MNLVAVPHPGAGLLVRRVPASVVPGRSRRAPRPRSGLSRLDLKCPIMNIMSEQGTRGALPSGPFPGRHPPRPAPATRRSGLASSTDPAHQRIVLRAIVVVRPRRGTENSAAVERLVHRPGAPPLRNGPSAGSGLGARSPLTGRPYEEPLRACGWRWADRSPQAPETRVTGFCLATRAPAQTPTGDSRVGHLGRRVCSAWKLCSHIERAVSTVCVTIQL